MGAAHEGKVSRANASQADSVSISFLNDPMKASPTVRSESGQPIPRSPRVITRSLTVRGSTSSQFGPAARSTLSGTSSAAPWSSPRGRPSPAGPLGSGASKTSSSWIWRSIRAWRPCVADRGGRRASIARLIRSAAEPWITVLTAVRSARFRFRPGRVLDPVDRPAAAEDRLDPAGRAAPLRGSA